MEEIGIPELTSEEVEKLCEIAEEAAREYVLSKVPPRRVSALNITVNTEGTKPITVSVDVEITLSPIMKDYNVEELSKEAMKRAFSSIEKYLREIACKSTK